MCIGTAMQVVEALAPDGLLAWCADGDTRERVDLSLVGAQPPGGWVLVFQGAARQVLSDEAAAHSRAARGALAAALAGHGDLDAFFADLVAEGPRLPDHLRP